MTASSELVLFFTAISTSAISSTLGMAGGLVMLSVLTVFVSLKEAVPIHGYTQFLSNIGRVVSHFKDINWKISIRFVSLVGPGAYLGVKAVTFMNSNWVQLIVASAILWIVLGPKPKAAKKRSPRFFILLGFFSSFTGMIAGATGPMIVPFFMGIGLDKKQMIGTKAFCQAVVQFIKIPAFAFFGGVHFSQYGRLLILLGVATVLGTWVGNRILDRLEEKTYERIIQWTVTLMAFRMVFQSTRVLFLN